MLRRDGLVDMHVHTRFSCDADDSLDALCRAAIERGLGGICFADHYDLNPADEGFGYYDYDGYSGALEAARERYGERLLVLKGIEFGEPHRYRREFDEVLARDYDVVIGSIHWLPEGFVGDRRLRDRLGIEGLFERYYREMLAMVTAGGFDVLAHFDFPRRYLGEASVPALVDEVLAAVVEREIAVEINTSPLRKGLDVCAPDADLLARYARAGGRRLVLGSDAHATSDVGAGFDRALALARAVQNARVGMVRGRRFVSLDG